MDNNKNYDTSYTRLDRSRYIDRGKCELPWWPEVLVPREVLTKDHVVSIHALPYETMKREKDRVIIASE